MTTSPSSPKERVETFARRLVSAGSDVARARGGRGHRAAGATAAARAAVPDMPSAVFPGACGVCAPRWTR
jgi:hypothetical protein